MQLECLGKTANKILEAEDLLDEEKWSELINIYGGNPHWLKIAATGIKDLFGARVAEYLQCKPLFLGDELTVQALETPGHTRDSLSYFIPQKKVLLC